MHHKNSNIMIPTLYSNHMHVGEHIQTSIYLVNYYFLKSFSNNEMLMVSIV